MSLPRYILKNPKLSDDEKKGAVAKLESLGESFPEMFNKSNTPVYLWWDKFKHKASIEGVSAEEAWFLTNQVRGYISSQTPIKAEEGGYFKWVRLPCTDEYLHRIDMHAGGNIVSRPSNDNQLIVRGIIEEAIASSQLEGAHTTRARAKKMILEGAEPRNESERMILNNYRTITAIEDDYKNSDLSLDMIFELHRMLTDGTIPSDEQGRLRTDQDEIVVQGNIGNEKYITHVPPNENFLSEEIKRLIDYANDKESGGFTHPVIKAIFLHFWIGYLHPFTDGNGRIARALFYWYLLKKNYWAMMYLPISTVIKKAPVQYAMAYIYSEQNNNDVTYFYDFHIRKIIESLQNFTEYVEKKKKKDQQLDKVLDENIILNDRQRRLIHYLLSNDYANTSVSSHAEINNISRQTAASDLKKLEGMQFVLSRREGKYVRYYSTEKLKRIKEKL